MRAQALWMSVEVVVGVRIVPRNHESCHWCPRHELPRNHRCCPRHALSPSNHVQSTIMNFPLLVPILNL